MDLLEMYPQRATRTKEERKLQELEKQMRKGLEEIRTTRKRIELVDEKDR